MGVLCLEEKADSTEGSQAFDAIHRKADHALRRASVCNTSCKTILHGRYVSKIGYALPVFNFREGATAIGVSLREAAGVPTNCRYQGSSGSIKNIDTVLLPELTVKRYCRCRFVSEVKSKLGINIRNLRWLKPHQSPARELKDHPTHCRPSRYEMRRITCHPCQIILDQYVVAIGIIPRK
jgi:hypothetical protein